MSWEPRTYDPVREDERARRLAMLKADNEARWRDLFNRQQSERDALFEPSILNSVRSAAFIYRALKRENPEAGLTDYFSVMTSEKLRLELAGRCQLRERKAMSKELAQAAATLHRSVDAEFDISVRFGKIGELDMKLVEVFQQTSPDYSRTMRGQAMPVDNMVRVASFETDLPLPDALSEAFRLTNDGDEGGWENNPRLRVEAVDRGNTSVGDVVVVDGEAYQCARHGWNKRPDFKSAL